MREWKKKRKFYRATIKTEERRRKSKKVKIMKKV